MDRWIEVLMLVISSGCLASLCTWWVNRKRNRARTVVEIDEQYIKALNQLREQLIKYQDENQKLYRAVARLEKAVTRAATCAHYAGCPIRDELQEQRRNDANRSPRHATSKKKTGDGSLSRADEPSEIDDSDAGAQSAPPNAVFSDRSGQASVRASIQGDTVYIDATCDSLQRMVLKQSEELTRIRSETTMQDKQAKIVREPTGWQWFWIRMGQLAIVYLIFRITKQYLNKK